MMVQMLCPAQEVSDPLIAQKPEEILVSMPSILLYTFPKCLLPAPDSDVLLMYLSCGSHILERILYPKLIRNSKNSQLFNKAATNDLMEDHKLL